MTSIPPILLIFPPFMLLSLFRFYVHFLDLKDSVCGHDVDLTAVFVVPPVR